MTQPRAIVPDKGVRPGFNETVSDIAKHVFVTIDASGTLPDSVELPSTGGEAVGVTMQTITSGYRGDVQTRGRAVVLVGAGGVTANDLVAVTTAGAVVTATTGNRVVGKAMTTTAAAAYAEIELSPDGLGPVAA